MVDITPQKEQDRIYFYAKILFVLISLVGGYQFIIYGCYWVIAGLMSNPSLTDLMGKPLGSDFVAFYAASKLALKGESASIYAITKMHAMQNLMIGTNIGLRPWHYPPSFLVMVLPLALFPYSISFILWIGSTMYGYLWIIKKIAPHRLTPWLFLAFPPAVINFFYGQNGFLSAILMGGGLILLDDKPFLGGLILGIISYKPQLAMLIPIALVAGKNWRALTGVAASSIGLALISLLVCGASTWQAFFQNVPYVTHLLKFNQAYWVKMPTIFAAMRLLGAGLPLAWLLNAVMTLAAIAVLAWIWWRRAALPLRAASLIIATFLSAPFAFEYDLVLLALPFAWLGWGEVTEGRRWGQGVLAIIWLSTYGSLWFPQLNLSLLALFALMGFVLYRFDYHGYA